MALLSLIPLPKQAIIHQETTQTNAIQRADDNMTWSIIAPCGADGISQSCADP